MKLPKHIFFQNVLTAEECDDIHTKYLQHIENGWRGCEDDFLKEKNPPQISLAYPFETLNIDQTNIVNRLTYLMQKNYPDKIKYTHSFLRMYKKNSSLPIHNDKKGLDLTLSIHIGGLENWPLHISNVFTDRTIGLLDEKEEHHKRFRQNYSSFLTPKGSGVACYAHAFPHWRDKLICDDSEYVMQIFCHWMIVDYFIF